jgi:hypothetical protein
MEVSLAKPMSDKRKQAQMKREQRKQTDPIVDSRNDFNSGKSIPKNNFGHSSYRDGPAHRPIDSFRE